MRIMRARNVLCWMKLLPATFKLTEMLNATKVPNTLIDVDLETATKMKAIKNRNRHLSATNVMQSG